LDYIWPDSLGKALSPGHLLKIVSGNYLRAYLPKVKIQGWVNKLIKKPKGKM
jgi:hypothetical protein